MEDLNPAAATPVSRHSACKRPPLGTDMSTTRRAVLNARRTNQMNRQPGFTAMSNKRLNVRIQERFTVLLVDEMARRQELGVTGEPDIRDLQRDAVRDIAKTLSPAAGSKLFRRRPSKTDSAAYRGIGGAGPRRQAGSK